VAHQQRPNPGQRLGQVQQLHEMKFDLKKKSCLHQVRLGEKTKFLPYFSNNII